MKSRTKNRLSEEQIRELVKIKFGDDCKVGTIIRLKDGVLNSVYLIERPNEEDKIILKVSVLPETKPLSFEQELLSAEVNVLKLVAQKTTIPVPRILNYDFSKKFFSGNYFFRTVLKGEVMSKLRKKLLKDNVEDIKKELAIYQTQLHQIKGEYFGFITNQKEFQFRTWKEAYLNMMRGLLNDGRERGYKLPYLRLERVFKEKSQYLEEVREPSLVDFDLWPSNILLKSDGNRYAIEGIVRFEHAFWGDPLANLPPSFALIRKFHKERRLWNTYKVMPGFDSKFTKGESMRLAFNNLFIFTIMTLEGFRYGSLFGNIQKIYSKKLLMKNLKILERT